MAPLLFLIAMVFRLPGLGRPIIFDESHAIGYVTGSFSKIVTGLMSDSQPPLYYYVLKCWAMLSSDPFFLRMLTVLLGSAICVILYKTVKAVFGIEAANYAFILAAISPQLIFQSQYLRPYCMATFFSSVLVYIFILFKNVFDIFVF